MKTVKVRMLVEVEFDPQGVSAEELGNHMIRVIDHGMGEGYFTGNNDATVEDWSAKIISTEEEGTQKYVRVAVSHAGYVVPADNEEAIEYAKESLADDLMGMAKQGEALANISVEPAPEASEGDVPEFISEFLESA